MKESRSISSVTPFNVVVKENLDSFTLENAYLKAFFDSNGLLTAVKRDKIQTLVTIQFVYYGTRKGNQAKSGAYLFLPDGPARILEPTSDHNVRIVKGSIRSQVVVHMPFVVHQVTLHHSPGVDGVALEIDNLVNVAGQNNLEVAMRLLSQVQSENAFYSDLNGLQVFKCHFKNVFFF